jgi:hypothetical protein
MSARRGGGHTQSEPAEGGLQAELAALRQRVAKLEAEREWLYDRLTYAGSRPAARVSFRGDENLARELAAAVARIRSMEASTSWRLTAGLRAVVTWLRATTREPTVLRLVIVGPPKLVWWILTGQLRRRFAARRTFFAGRRLAAKAAQTAPSTGAIVTFDRRR